MAINIKFDLVGNPETPTIILANRNGNKLGQLKVDGDSIELSDKFNDASEISFTINKYINEEITPLWDKIVDFKLIYCKEWDTWFEIKVELDEETKTVKTVLCTQLGQAELSQIMLYDIEINTEDDIARDDYKISILYDENDPEASILNRILEKAPHYSIVHVDSTIAKIQRSFSFDGTSIVDAFNEIAEEIGCLFVYHSNSDENGRIQRTISVYDLQQKCLNIDCGYRGEFTDKCPKCGSTDIKYGYGDDTLIFVTSDELASSGIQLVTDVDSVKNCFKLEAGDDLMTATIRNCNPNGTDYIWYFSDSLKEDMSDELVNKLESYDEIYKSCYSDYESNIDSNILDNYNSLIDKYSKYNEDLIKINSPIKGHSDLMNAYYNVIDLSLYLESGLMPSIKMNETSATEQVGLLTSSALSPVAVNTENINSVTITTANSAVLSMAKIIVKSTYKVEIGTSTLSNDKVWRGNFIVTNYSDEEDVATSEIIEVLIGNDTETFIKQKIDKALNKENTDDYSISGLFEKNYDAFCAELKKYAINPLKNFYDVCDSCLSILIDNDAGNKDEKPDLYEKLYEPYYRKSTAIADEIKLREAEIAIIDGVYDETNEDNKVLIVKGLRTYIEECKSEIQKLLDFEKYLGEKLWLEFCAYRREDKYSNSNYISDGLNNTELFEKAKEFFEVAENEIYKSAELQHSISTTLNNLLAIPKFKSLVDSFSVGNWIRVQIDNEIYKLRLLKYEISYGDFGNIPVEFSDVRKIKNGITDVESILSQASSMATSYDSIQKQAKQGNEAYGTIDDWLSTGLNSALVRIQNNDSEEITLTKNGLLGRSYNEITDSYSPEQFKLTHNIMAYTTDNWNTVSSALGKHEYVKWQNNQWVKDVDYGLSSTFVTAGYVTGSQIIGGEIVSSNYKSGESGTYFNLIDGDFEIAGGNIVYDTSDKALTLRNVTIEWSNSTKPEVTVNDITGIEDYLDNIDKLEDKANSAYTLADGAKSVAENAKTIGDKLVNGLGFKETEISGNYVISPVIAGGTLLIGDKEKTYAQITTDGKLVCTGANISGKITATSGSITGDLTLGGSLSYTSKDGKHIVKLRGIQEDDTDAAVFWITNNEVDDVFPFVLYGNGGLVATNARIKGEIEATSLTLSDGSDIEDKIITLADGQIDAAYISADKITSGALSSNNIHLMGMFDVYDSTTTDFLGGHIGYGSGNVGGIPTDGIAMYSPSYNNYIIVTSAGVRMQSSSADIHVQDENAVINGKVFINGVDIDTYIKNVILS